MSGSRSRSRGKRGEREARDLLTERDWDVLDLTDGVDCADFAAVSPAGILHSVEVKNTKSINVPAFVAQAKRQAGRHKWLLLARIDRYPGCWLVIGSDVGPTVWRGKGAA